MGIEEVFHGLSLSCFVKGLLDKYLIPSAEDIDSKVFYLKMLGDYLRYVAETKDGDENFSECSQQLCFLNTRLSQLSFRSDCGGQPQGLPAGILPRHSAHAPDGPDSTWPGAQLLCLLLRYNIFDELEEEYNSDEGEFD